MSVRLVARISVLILPWLLLIPLSYIGEWAEVLFWKIERHAPGGRRDG